MLQQSSPQCARTQRGARSATRAPLRRCAAASRRCCTVQASSIKSVRKVAQEGGGFKETFGVDLLGLGKLTEQALQSGPNTQLVPLTIRRPLGVVFAEKKSLNSVACVVDELVPGSHAAAAGVQVGDTLRLVTAVVETRGKVDTISFYANPPKARRQRALLVADGQPFGKLMKALLSNAEEVDLPTGDTHVFDDVPIVLERSLPA